MNAYFRKAISLAHESPSKYRLGAVLVNNKKVFYGKNYMNRTHPLGLYLLESEWVQVGVHAEMDALIAAKDNAEHSSLYVARVRRDGSLGSSRPCIRCRYLIRKAGVFVVHFTDDEGEWFREYPSTDWEN